MISKSDFVMLPAGFGTYRVTYMSPKTKKSWTAIVTDMELIDAIKHVDYPKKKDLESLKRSVKLKVDKHERD